MIDDFVLFNASSPCLGASSARCPPDDADSCLGASKITTGCHMNVMLVGSLKQMSLPGEQKTARTIQNSLMLPVQHSKLLIC